MSCSARSPRVARTPTGRHHAIAPGTPVAVRSIVRSSILALLLVAGCDSVITSGSPCGGAAGLHVSVDLSAGACAHLSQPINWGVQLTIGGATLNTLATSQTFDYATHRADYYFAWPAGEGDGSPGRADWYGSGDGEINGHASGTFTVQRDSCVGVELAPACTQGVDAGAP
jgi:hypothetical protein